MINESTTSTPEFIDSERAIYTSPNSEETIAAADTTELSAEVIWQKIEAVKESLYLSDGNMKYLKGQLQSLVEFKRKLQEAQVILLPSIEGIGDMIQKSRCAISFALQFPQAQVYIEDRYGELANIPDAPANLRVITRADKINLASIITRVAVVNLGIISQIQDDWLKHKFTIVNRFDYRPRRLAMLDCPSSEGYLGLFDLWRYIVNPEITPLTDALFEISKNTLSQTRTRDIPSPARQHSSHVTKDLASKLVAVGINLSPTFITDSLIYMPERLAEAMSDLTIVYDSAANQVGDKTLGSQQLIEIIRAIKAEFPHIKITIVRGLNNPKMADTLGAEFPDIRIFSSQKYRDVMDLLVNSRVTFSGDTGFTHHLNEYRRIMHHKFHQDWKDLPQLVQYIGTGPAFPVNHYRADCADVGIIVKDYVDDVPPRVYIEPISQALHDSL